MGDPPAGTGVNRPITWGDVVALLLIAVFVYFAFFAPLPADWDWREVPRR